MNDTIETDIIQDRGAAVRLVALLQEAHEICSSHNWPYMLNAVAVGEEVQHHVSGKVDLRDEGVRGILASLGEDGFCLSAAANAHCAASVEWAKKTTATEERNEDASHG